MKKILIIVLFISIYGHPVLCQKYFSKTATISFYSSTPMEDIEALSNTASTVVDFESGAIQWAVLIKSFLFEKALMQEHFNENYMDSNTYPKATFKGQILNIEEVLIDKDGSYPVRYEGELQIHGVSQTISSSGMIEVVNGEINAATELVVAVADYGIKIPAIVRENIAKEINVKVAATYEPLKM